MTDTKTISFLDKNYTEAGLGGMSDDDLLTLRNLVASNLGVASVKAFKDHETAVAQTWKALVKYEETLAEEAGEGGAEAKPAKAKKVKEPKEPKERKLAKPAHGQHVKRPNRDMFATVKIIKQHTGAEGRAHRWPNYRDGMTVMDAIEGEGTLQWDINNWVSKGLMELVPPTDEEYAERRAAWFKKHGREDPDLSKETKKAEREKAKQERAEAAAAKKAEREAAAAAKKAAAEAAKAEAAKEAAE